METHNSTRDKPTFQCPECTNLFYYQTGLDHHYETHVCQKRRESGLYSDEDNNDKMDPVPKENKGRGKKHTIDVKTGQDVVTKKGKKSVDSAIETKTDLQSVNSTENGDAKKESMNSASKPKPKRGRGRPRKNNPLPKQHRGKKIKTESDLNTSEDTERQRDIEQGIAALEHLKQKKKDQEAAIFASLKTQHQLRSGRDLIKTDKTEDNADKENTNKQPAEQPNEDKCKKPKNRGRRPKKEIQEQPDPPEENPEIEKPDEPEKNILQDEDEEKKIKPKNRKGKKGSKGSTSKDKAKNNQKDEQEEPSEDGKSLRNRTINLAVPSTSENEDEVEVLEAEEFMCKICGKSFKDYNQIKAHKLLCTKLNMHVVYVPRDSLKRACWRIISTTSTQTSPKNTDANLVIRRSNRRKCT